MPSSPISLEQRLRETLNPELRSLRRVRALLVRGPRRIGRGTFAGNLEDCGTEAGNNAGTMRIPFP